VFIQKNCVDNRIKQIISERQEDKSTENVSVCSRASGLVKPLNSLQFDKGEL
jgi:hypothetical protein